MNDNQETLAQSKARVARFAQEREWNQFHSPKNLSMAMAVEAAELMEKFLWIDPKDSYQEVMANRQEIEDELADILMYLLNFANVTNIDLSNAMENKMRQNAVKYPVEKSKGRSTKYDKL
jgi:dCTP diphosphatase